MLPHTRVVLFGEVHGTAEAPEMVGHILSATASARTLAVEWPDSLQRAVDAYLATGRLAALIATPDPFWSYRDGRSSLAMIALLDRARSLEVPVVCFDGEHESPDDRERRMATRLHRAVEARPENLLIALCGDLHARTTEPWMAWHLQAAVPELQSYELHHEGGTAWCITDDGAGPHEIAPNLGPPPHRGPYELRTRNERGFDGGYSVGMITASMPVR